MSLSGLDLKHLPGALLGYGLLVATATAADCPLDRLKADAASGQSEAQFRLGVHLFRGDCSDTDLVASTRWFETAAQQGHTAAAFNLGNAYHQGRGVQPDPLKTRYWWRRAAFDRLPSASYNLGLWHLKHHQTVAHRELGVAWLEIASEEGWGDARTLLGRLPISGGSSAVGPWQREPLRSEALLLTRPPGGYVIQLFSSVSPNAAQRFVRDHDLVGSALVFRLPVDGELRWNVAYGNYADRLAARRTLLTLRKDLAAYEPWPRALAEIQQHIRGVWRQRHDTDLDEPW